MFTSLALLFNVLTNSSLKAPEQAVLASRSFSLEDRYSNTFVNDVFKDNILLTVSYLDGKIKSKADINWSDIEKPFKTEFTLEPGQRFAFHDSIAPEFKNGVVKTTGAHFNFSDGFKSDGLLYGDGVCHLASLIYWAAKDAGLDAVHFANHDFAKINDVPREYGVSIKYMPGDTWGSERQNLYITNNKDKRVTFVFEYKNNELEVRVLEAA